VADSNREKYARGSLNWLLVAVVIFAFTLGRSYFQGEPEWERFRSEEGGFAVLAAGVPDERTIEEEVAGGRTASRYFSFGRGGVLYAVAYVDLPSGQVQSSGPGEILDQARQALAGRVQGKALEEEKISLEEYAGRRWRFAAGDGSLLLAEGFLVDERLYTLMAGMEEESANQVEVEGFFASFTLLEKDDPVAGSD